MGGAKTSFILGGRGLKPDTNFKSVSPGRFTKASRNRKVMPTSKCVMEDGIGKK